MVAVKRVLLVVLITSCVHMSSERTLEREEQESYVYKICVRRTKTGAQNIVNRCNDLAKDLTKYKIYMKCFEDDNRMDCLSKIAKGERDLMFITNMEDLYAADKFFPGSTKVVAEMQTAQTRNQDDVFVIVRDDAGIRRPDDLRGKKICATNTDSKWSEQVTPSIPMKMTIQKLVDFNLLERPCSGGNAMEAEMASFNGFVGSSCTQGEWGSRGADRKKKYTKLCSLCMDRRACESGSNSVVAPSAIACFMNASADAAFAFASDIRKVYYSFDDYKFKDSTRRGQYKFLCLNDRLESIRLLEKLDIGSSSCSWGAVPWPVFVARSSLGSRKISELRRELLEAFLQNRDHSRFFFSRAFPAIQEGAFLSTAIQPLSPSEYLRQANYLSVFTPSAVCSSDNNTAKVRFCVMDEEMKKCKAMEMAAEAENMVPRISCVVGKNYDDCMSMIDREEAELVVLDDTFTALAEKSYKLSVVMELEASNDPVSYSLAVVKKDSGIESLDDLTGKTRSCHVNFADMDFSWSFPMSIFEKMDSQKNKSRNVNDSCSQQKFFDGQFTESCVYGSIVGANQNCQECRIVNSTKCPEPTSNRTEAEMSAFECLVDDRADVVFINVFRKENNTYQFTQINTNDASEVDKYRLLCSAKKKSQPLDQYRSCNLGDIEGRTNVVTKGDSSSSVAADVRYVMERLVKMQFEEDDSMIKPFQPFDGKSNLIFDDTVFGYKKGRGDSRENRAENGRNLKRQASNSNDNIIQCIQNKVISIDPASESNKRSPPKSAATRCSVHFFPVIGICLLMKMLHY